MGFEFILYRRSFYAIRNTKIVLCPLNTVVSFYKFNFVQVCIIKLSRLKFMLKQWEWYAVEPIHKILI